MAAPPRDLGELFGKGAKIALQYALKAALQTVNTDNNLRATIAKTMAEAEGEDWARFDTKSKALWINRAQSALSALMKMVP